MLCEGEGRRVGAPRKEAAGCKKVTSFGGTPGGTKTGGLLNTGPDGRIKLEFELRVEGGECGGVVEILSSPTRALVSVDARIDLKPFSDSFALSLGLLSNAVTRSETLNFL